MKYPIISQSHYNGIHTIPLDDAMFNDRSVYLNNEVNYDTVNSLMFQFLYLDKQSQDDPIKFYINTPGGDCTAGLCLYDVIRNISAPVITINVGMCASMGSILFLAGDTRCMLEHATVFIHDPLTDMGIVQPMSAMEKLESLDEMRNELARIISSRTGQKLDIVKDLTSKETYFNYEEAKSFGFVTNDYDVIFKGGH